MKLPLLAAALKGALIGAVIGGIIGGISSMLQGGSFFEGFLKGAIEGAISGALFGEIGALGQLLGHSCKVLKSLGQFAKVIPKIAKISGITSLTMAGFDMLS